ncbi:MAG: hypothetical protein ACKO21_04700 [Nodosilinea sp.]
MRWYTFWDDQGQFHRLPSVTTILNLTQPPQARAQLTQALANHPLASTRKRQTSRQQCLPQRPLADHLRHRPQL